MITFLLFSVVFLTVGDCYGASDRLEDVGLPKEKGVDDTCVFKAVIKDIFDRRFLRENPETKTVKQEVEGVFNIFKSCAKQKLEETDYFQKIKKIKEKFNVVIDELSELKTEVVNDKNSLIETINQKTEGLGKVANDFIRVFIPNSVARTQSSCILISCSILIFKYIL